jgi:YesN/AraC family two-component response regulator
MSQPSVIRVLLIDDHPIVQQGLAAIINEESDMTVIGRARDGPEAIEVFHQEQPE